VKHQLYVVGVLCISKILVVMEVLLEENYFPLKSVQWLKIL